MSITEQGLQGEKMARIILKDKWKVDNIFQADWMVLKNGKYYVIEVKHKELFVPPPFYGQGLDIRQVNARMKFYKYTGIRCLFLVISKPDNSIFWKYLDELEETRYFDTRNKVRIHDINFFNKGGIVPQSIAI
jgi:hypothetical protein